MQKRSLEYVALGDSYTWGFVDLYAGHLRVDLSVEIILHNYSTGGQSSAEMLEVLCGYQKLRILLRTADVITFMVPMACFKEPSIEFTKNLSRGVDSQNGMRDAFEHYRQATDEIFNELLFLRSPSGAILRVMDCYLPTFLFDEWARHGAYQQLKFWWEAFNDHVVQTASAYGIPVAFVRRAFNGASGDVNPVEFIDEDGWHTNERGAALVAKIHRELGYAPLAS